MERAAKDRSFDRALPTPRFYLPPPGFPTSTAGYLCRGIRPDAQETVVSWEKARRSPSVLTAARSVWIQVPIIDPFTVRQGAFARHGSLGPFVLAVPTLVFLIPPASTLIPYSLEHRGEGRGVCVEARVVRPEHHISGVPHLALANPGIEHWRWRLKARNSLGEGPWSTWQSFRVST